MAALVAQPDRGTIAQHSKEDITLDINTSESSGPIICHLYTQCLQVLDLCAHGLPSQRLHTTRLKLNLWGSGLFGEFTLVGLDYLPSTAANRGLLHYVIGTLADIASTLDCVCETIGSDLIPKWTDLRPQLLATLCLDSVIDQMLDNTWISKDSYLNVENLSSCIDRCCSEIDEFIECLFDVLPSIGLIARVSELHAEANREQQTKFASVNQHVNFISSNDDTIQCQGDSDASLMLESSSSLSIGRHKNSDRSIISSSTQSLTSISTQSTAPSSVCPAIDVIKHEQTHCSFSDALKSGGNENAKDHDASSLAHRADFEIYPACPMDADEAAPTDNGLSSMRKNAIGVSHIQNRTYKKVSVLLLSWDADSDDLGVEAEVDELEAVFRDNFNYEVQSTRLTSNSTQNAQVQTILTIAKWVTYNDDKSLLLIVYYAGHGNVGTATGNLELYGRNSPNGAGLQAYNDQVVWDKAESILLDTEADILEIFDCCYAGSAARRPSDLPIRNLTSMPSGSRPPLVGKELSVSMDNQEANQSRHPMLEYLAATSSDSAPSPGESSFTSALIWALKTFQKDNSRFTTRDLLDRIIHAPNLHRGLTPILASYSPTLRRGAITLEPLRPPKKATEPKTVDESLQKTVKV